MLVGVIVLAVAAVLLLALAVARSRQLTVLDSRLEAETAALAQARVDHARATEHAEQQLTHLHDTTAALHETNADLETQVADLETRIEALGADLADLNDELDAGDRLAADQSAELASMAIEAEDLRSRIAGLEQALATARATTSAAHPGTMPELDPGILWQLELARSERTWRYSVAMFPDDESPFAETDDPLRLAVETESAALRDEVGAFLSVDWRIGSIDRPGHCHLILRVAQEMLAQAARVEEPTVLVVTADAKGNVVLRLLPSEEGDQPSIDLRQFEQLGSCIDGVVVPDPGGEATITVVTSS